MEVPSTIVVFLALLCMGRVKATPSCIEDGSLYTVDLDTGTFTDHWANNVNPTPQPLQGFSAHLIVPLSYVQSIKSRKGVLKITIPQATVQNRALKFKFTFDPAPNTLGVPSFHIGDSENNMADGSDYAEVFNDGTTLKVYANTHMVSPIPYFPDEVSFISQSQNVDTEITIGDKFIQAISGNQVKDYSSSSLFSLDGTTDLDIFLGMNQKIKPQGSLGKGLHLVEISALTC